MRQTSFVLDGSGHEATTGVYRATSASGQPGGISVSQEGSWANFAGFLHTYNLHPELDTDADGVNALLDPPVLTTEVVGGTAPWFVTTGTYTEVTRPGEYFKVEVLP